MYFNTKCFVVSTFLFASTLCYCQPSFSNKTREFKRNTPTRSTIAGGIADMDGDLIDDLVVLDRGKKLTILKSSGKLFGLSLLDTLTISSNKKWSLTMGDINNDGVNDVLTSGIYDNINISSYINQGWVSNNIIGNFYAQASNTVDINGDGWLDFFACNDEGYNKIYINDGTGRLALKNIINFSLNDNTDGSGNYGSEWVDINGDYLPDLYISKCRAGIDDPSDKRRINQLYINQGNSVFEEKSAEYGLNIGAQSWVTAFGDIDNDGDQDAYIVNHYAPHLLMENIDGQFFKQILPSEEINEFSFQAVMRDFDNDGYLDILLSGIGSGIVLHNNHDKTFSRYDNIFSKSSINSLTVGDVNDDGFLDVHAHIGEPINDVGFKDDELWVNEGNENHFVKFTLEGSTSNKSGIGAQLEIYGPWGVQVRYVKGGESYGIFNSFQQHFGIGLYNKIDTLIVRWPSGITDSYTSLGADQTYLIQEGKCITSTLSITDEQVFYVGQPITLIATDGQANYKWNTGQTSKSIIIDTMGTYHVRMTDEMGCTTVSKPISIISGCFDQSRKLILEDPFVNLCSGENFTPLVQDAASYLWSNGDTVRSLLITTPRFISLTATDRCGQTMSDFININFFDAQFSLVSDTIAQGEKATLISDSPNTYWYTNQDDIVPIFVGDTLLTIALDTSTFYFAQTIQIIDQKSQILGQTTYPIDNAYGSNNTLGGLLFDVFAPCILNTVTVITDTSAVRKIVITDQKNTIVFQKDVFVPSGVQKIMLNASLLPGVQYKISTDENTNFTQLGHKGPRFARTFNNTSFPYFIDDVMSINTSTFGAIYYYYFYNWEISYDMVTCESEKTKVLAFVNKPTKTDDDPILPAYQIYPNPIDQQLSIISNIDAQKYDLTIWNMQGQKIVQHIEKNKFITLDVSHLPSGSFILQIKSDLKIQNFKLIKH